MPPTDSSIHSFFPSPPLQRIQMRSKPKRMLPQLHLQLQLELCIPCNSLVICVSLLAAAQPEKKGRAEENQAELSCSLLSESCQKYFALLLLGLVFSLLFSSFLSLAHSARRTFCTFCDK